MSLANDTLEYGATSTILTIWIYHSTTGAGLTALTSSSTGMILSLQAHNGAVTAYTVAASNVETITTLRTFAQPSSGKIRFKEIDATNKPGAYEVQIRDDIVPASPAKWLELAWTGATNMLTGSQRLQMIPTNWRALSVDSNGRLDVIKIAGTTQTARDLGASVLLSTLESPVQHSGTAQAGASSTLTLAAGASATDNLYKGSIVKLYGGTGAGQTRVITGYVGSTKVATVGRAWATTPDNTSTYAVLAGSVPVVDDNLAVILQAGTGTGQLDVTSGVVKANLAQILGTALTETAGQLAAAFKKFFDKSSPTGTINSLPDAVAGATNGLLIAGTNAATTVNITGNVTGNLSGSVGSVTGAVGSVTAGVTLATGSIAAATFAAGAIDASAIATDAIGSAEISAAAVTKIQAGLSTYAGGDTTGTGTLLTRLTALRAGYLDNLNVGGNVASSAEVVAIQNNTRVVRVVPEVIERPDSGTTTYRVELLLYDDVGDMEVPDSAPTIALVNQAGTDRSSRLDSTTMTLVSTGRYRAIYTADVGDALEQLVWSFSVVEGGATRIYGNSSLLVDITAVDFTSADRTKLDGLFAKLPSKAFLAGTTNSDGDIQMDEATGNYPGSVGSLASAGLTALVSAVWAAATRVLTAGTNIVLAKGTGLTGLNDPSPADILDQALSGHTTAGTVGGALQSAGSAGDPWATLLPGSYSAGQAGKLVGDGLTGHIPQTGNVYPLVDTEVAAIKAKTDLLPASPAAVGSAMTLTSAYDPAKTAAQAGDAMTLTSGERDTLTDALVDQPLAGHTTAGTVGGALQSASSAGDPWTTALPGSYSAGQAGKIVGDTLNATVGSRASQTSVDDVPTNAELATALAGADDATLAAIAALNDVGAPDIRAAVGLATGNLDTQLAAIASHLPEGIKKNQAFTNFAFKMVLESDHLSAATGLTVTATRAIDGGTFADCTNSPTEMSNGFYKINLSAADLNGDFITLRFTAGTADTRTISLKTSP